MPQAVELVAVQLPGRESRLSEQPLTRIADVVAVLADEMIPYLDRRYAFFGHSLGSHIAFELAQLLRRKEQARPDYLFASAARAPHLPDRHPPIYHLPDDEFIQELCGFYDGIPREVLDNPELMELMMKPLRADAEMCDTYRYQQQPQLDCAIAVLGGDADDLTHEELDAWRTHTTETFKLRMFAGGHFYLQEHQRQIVQLISDEMQATVPFGH